ncbi:hypothetical protein BCU44_09685 [Vibrio cyclitrophicus]|nr:hypothetical protein BCU44_09685 [Vibrio cyclitrophicus]
MTRKMTIPLIPRIRFTLVEGACEKVSNLYRKMNSKSVLIKSITILSNKVQFDGNKPRLLGQSEADN